MNCPSCGRQIAGLASVCSSCGATLVDPESPTIAPSGHSVARSVTLPASGISSNGRFHPGMMLVERYRIAGLLGRGGMGEVYRAEVRVALAGRPVFDGLMKE